MPISRSARCLTRVVATIAAGCALSAAALVPAGASISHLGRLPVNASPAAVSNAGVALRGPMKNAVYGTIAKMSGTTLTLRTRTGRLRLIDAGPAIAAGTISAPLFIGKIVVAEGLTRVDGVLTAARISRLTHLEGNDPDR